MAMSGIEVSAEVSTIYNDIKLRSTHRYALFKIEQKRRIVIDCLGDRSATYDEFLEKLRDIESQNESRYALFDFEIQHGERALKKIAFIFWCPDTTKVAVKMIYASSKDTIKKAFTGLGLEFQGNSLDDIVYEDLRQEIIRRS